MRYRIYRAVYAFVSTWLVAASCARIAISLENGVALDALPFVSIGLGVLMFFVFPFGKSDTLSVSRNPAQSDEVRNHGEG